MFMIGRQVLDIIYPVPSPVLNNNNGTLLVRVPDKQIFFIHLAVSTTILNPNMKFGENLHCMIEMKL